MNIARSDSPWVSYYVPDKAYNGYTLFTPMGGSAAWLIDMEGRFLRPLLGDATPWRTWGVTTQWESARVRESYLGQ